MNFQEQFYQMMTRMKSNSKAASARITEVTDGLLVSKPTTTKEPVVIDLQEYAKSHNKTTSENVNKVKAKEIYDFITSNGRI